MLRESLEAELEFDPLSLSEPPVQIEIGESEYSHEKQIRVYKTNNDVVMFTFRATSTGGVLRTDTDDD